jgi:hypothetical protein
VVGDNFQSSWWLVSNHWYGHDLEQVNFLVGEMYMV